MTPNSPLPDELDVSEHIDEAALRDSVMTERMRQYMNRQRLISASGAMPSAYLVFLHWERVDHFVLLAWWVALFTVDMMSLAHSWRYMATQPPVGQARRWRWRQIGLQTTAGLVWGLSVVLFRGVGNAYQELDTLLVVITMHSIAAIGMLPFISAMAWFSVAVFAPPVLYDLTQLDPHRLKLDLGALVLLSTLHTYLGKASNQLVAGIVERFRAETLARALHEAAMRIHKLATEDELTGLFNRRQGMRLLGLQMARSRRQPSTDNDGCLLLLDIDHFKRVNDTHGHPAGDAVLREVAARLTASLREGDSLSRIGGEEFMVLLPRTNLDAGLLIAARLRRAVIASPVTLQMSGVRLEIRVSMGLALLDPTEDMAQALSRADAALYEAKRTGRDRVVCAPSAGAAAQSMAS